MIRHRFTIPPPRIPVNPMDAISTLHGFVGDISTAEAADEVSQKYPAVETPVNNLGIYEPKAFEDISGDDWRRLFEVNVLSGVRLARLQTL